MKVKASPIMGLKAGPDDGLADGEFVVYPSTFTKTPDAYGDIVAPGAFTETIQAWKDSGNVLPGLFGHRMDDPDFYVASAVDMGEDEKGWWVKGKFDLDSPKGKQTYRLVKGRRLNKLSFAYDVADEGKVELDDGTKANELRKLNVHEFSFVPVPANPDAGVAAVKDAADAFRATAAKELSDENDAKIREAIAALESVLQSQDDDQEDEEPEGEASGSDEAKQDASDETNGKSSVSREEQKRGPSADAVLAVISIREKGA